MRSPPGGACGRDPRKSVRGSVSRRLGAFAVVALVTGCSLVTSLDDLTGARAELDASLDVQVADVGDGGVPYFDAEDGADAADTNDALADVVSSNDAGLDAAPPPVAWRASLGVIVPYVANPTTTSITLNRPFGTAAKDALIAVLAVGRTGGPLPTFTVPAGWSLVQRNDYTVDISLIVYVHTATSSEPASYTWVSNTGVEGQAWISAYTGANNSVPVGAYTTVARSGGVTQYTSPTVPVGRPGTLLVLLMAGHAAPNSVWKAPAGTTERVNLVYSSRSAFQSESAAVGSVGGPFTASTSLSEDYVLTGLLALQP